MANEEQKKLTPEEEQAEKERLERIKKEEKELKKKAKEKEKRRKEREKKIRIKEKKEEKRIRGIVNFPIKTLFQVSLFFTSVAFLIIYFGNELDLEKAIYLCSLIFILLFFTPGIVMVIGYWKISDERIKDMEAKRKKEKEEEDERLKREEEELEKLLRAEIDDEDGFGSDDSKLLSSNDGSDAYDIPEINFDSLDEDEKENQAQNVEENEDVNIFESDDEPESENKKDELKASDEPEPFFNEDDFMSEVIFGSNKEKEQK